MYPKPKEGRRHTPEEIEDHDDKLVEIGKAIKAEYAKRPMGSYSGAEVVYSIKLAWLRYCGRPEAKIRAELGDPPPAPLYVPPTPVPSQSVELPEFASKVSSSPVPAGAGTSPVPAPAARTATSPVKGKHGRR